MKILKKISRLSGVVACFLLSGAVMAQSRFSYSADGAEVTDSRTGLVWQRCSAGQAWSGSTCTGTASTFTHEGALAHAQSQAGWRLPNVKELSSLSDKTKSNPAIDSTAFPATDSSSCWSSSPYVGSADYASWVVDFQFGYVIGDYRNGYGHVRLVR
ncbi:MAG: DUF1566 domain-containing protein [Xanthomonadaceae bacterium]|nr:DUF1566 domain-containing protein [Xanthomonadaceae bacterium]